MWSDHLITLPVLLPLVVGATLLLIDDSRRAVKGLISLVSSIALLATTIVLPPPIGSNATPPAAAVVGVFLVFDSAPAVPFVLFSILSSPASVYVCHNNYIPVVVNPFTG